MATVRNVNVDEEDAKLMLGELSKALYDLTGNSGVQSFDCDDMKQERSVFAVAYEKSEPCGCGAIRKIDEETAEMKRVYAKYEKLGIGRSILTYLEKEARTFNYKRIVLETRKINTHAVNFYLNNGYVECENYGKYKGRAEAVCFEKIL